MILMKTSEGDIKLELDREKAPKTVANFLSYVEANHYNDTVKALSGRQGLRGKVERFADLSSKVTQAIPEIEPLHSDIQSESLELLAEPLIEEEAPEDELPVT